MAIILWPDDNKNRHGHLLSRGQHIQTGTMTSPDTTLSAGSTSTTASASPTATCLHVEPGKNGYLPPEACGAILLYKPSLVPAAIFFILFGLATVFHFIQVCIHRKLYALVIVMGSGWEFIAMACRSMETRHQDSSKYYIYFTVFFLVAPICKYDIVYPMVLL